MLADENSSKKDKEGQNNEKLIFVRFELKVFYQLFKILNRSKNWHFSTIVFVLEIYSFWLLQKFELSTLVIWNYFYISQFIIFSIFNNFNFFKAPIQLSSKAQWKPKKKIFLNFLNFKRVSDTKTTTKQLNGRLQYLKFEVLLIAVNVFADAFI